MADRALVGDEEDWTAAHKRKVRRLFRAHTQTETNPKGRIVRLDCVFWGGHGIGRHRVEQPSWCLGSHAEAHHVTYAKPFLVVWLCVNCHAKAHARKLALFPLMLCDYSSLVANIQRSPPGTGRRRRLSAAERESLQRRKEAESELEPAPF